MKDSLIGKYVPEFDFISTDPAFQNFSNWRGKNIVLYFYPKDNTPGCTKESKDFAAMKEKFSKLNTEIVGVSRDSVVCHQKFQSKQALTFPLISDPDETLCRYFNVMIEKNMFKKIFLGIERSTFLIDGKGIIRKEWRSVKVKEHANQVYEAVVQLSASMA